MRRILNLLATMYSLLLPGIAAAYTSQPVNITFLGFNTTSRSVRQIIEGIVLTLRDWAHGLAIALFLFGAFCMIASRGKDDGFFALSKGKKIMEASLIGLAIVYGSWLILSTVLAIIGA